MRVLSLKIRDYVDKMSAMWVEGQVVQLQRRGNTAYLTLRDPEVDMSLSATISVHALNAMGSPLLEGARVVLQAKPTFWERRGTLQLDGRQIRPVGVGDLLARLAFFADTQVGWLDRLPTCWPGLRSSKRAWPPRACSIGIANAGCRSCPAGSG